MSLTFTDRQAIVDALSAYAWGYDQMDFGRMAEAFSADATSGGKVTGTDFSWGPMAGRDAIVAGLREMREGQTIQPRHCLTNVLFTASGTGSASLRCYLTLMAVENGKTGVATCGTLDVDAVQEAGEWRINRLEVTLDAPF